MLSLNFRELHVEIDANFWSLPTELKNPPETGKPLTATCYLSDAVFEQFSLFFSPARFPFLALLYIYL